MTKSYITQYSIINGFIRNEEGRGVIIIKTRMTMTREAKSDKLQSKVKMSRIGLMAVAFVTILIISLIIIYFKVLARDKGSSQMGITEEQFQEQKRIIEEAASMFFDIKERAGKEEAVNQTIAWLKEQEEVEEAGDDIDSIFIKFIDGTGFAIYTADPFEGAEEPIRQ